MSTREIFAELSQSLNSAGALTELGGMYGQVLDEDDTGLESWEYGHTAYSPWYNDIYVHTGHYEEGWGWDKFKMHNPNLGLSARGRLIEEAYLVPSLMQEFWHAYWDQVLEENRAPRLWEWLKGKSKAYGLGTTKYKEEGELEEWQHLKVLNEAIGNTIEDYVRILYSKRYGIDTESPIRQSEDDKFNRMPGYLNIGIAQFDDDTKVLDEDTWTVVRFIMKYGAYYDTDPELILDTPETGWGTLAKRWHGTTKPIERPSSSLRPPVDDPGRPSWGVYHGP